MTLLPGVNSEFGTLDFLLAGPVQNHFGGEAVIKAFCLTRNSTTWTQRTYLFQDFCKEIITRIAKKVGFLGLR